MGALAIPRLSVEEYLAIDRAAELKSEYRDGEMFPLAAVSWPHAQLAVTVAAALRSRLQGGPCRVGVAPIRVRVAPTEFVYPDIVVVCGKPALTDEHADTMTNPKLIVEVLSPSTEDYDYGKKFAGYRKLASLEEYVLVSQGARLVEVFRRTPEGRWTLSSHPGEDASIPLDSLGFAIPAGEIYSDIEL